ENPPVPARLARVGAPSPFRQQPVKRAVEQVEKGLDQRIGTEHRQPSGLLEGLYPIEEGALHRTQRPLEFPRIEFAAALRGESCSIESGRKALGEDAGACRQRLLRKDAVRRHSLCIQAHADRAELLAAPPEILRAVLRELCKRRICCRYGLGTAVAGAGLELQLPKRNQTPEVFASDGGQQVVRAHD